VGHRDPHVSGGLFKQRTIWAHEGRGLMHSRMTTAGDVEEYSGLVEMHRRAIFRFLLVSLRDENLAQTITQQCLLEACRKRSTLQRGLSVKACLLRIAIDLEKGYRRDRRIQFWRKIGTGRAGASPWPRSRQDMDRQPDAQLLKEERVATVWRAVENLSARERSVFLLRYVEELELHEICHCTGLKAVAVEACLEHALSRVRLSLGQ
jgi:RNA polymerase sigma-70 factor, ECF subfamily